MKVKSIVQEMVRPPTSLAQGGGVMKLSVMDMIQPRVYFSWVFCFKEKAARRREEETRGRGLKESLAETLAVFYPLAGRLRESSAGGRLEIECSHAGALFVEAFLDDDFPSDFSHTHPDFTTLLLPPLPPSSAPLSSIPLLLAQLSFFECGNATLGIHFHHTVCDARSAVHFLSSWAVLTKSKYAMDLKMTKSPMLVLPYLDRSILNANSSFPWNSDHPEYHAQLPNFPTKLPPCIPKMFSFTPSYIDGLREKAKSGPSPSHTRFEALATHLWRGITIARGPPLNQEIHLVIPIDGRRRFNPALPEGYFGNASFVGFVSATVEDVLGNPDSHVTSLVKSILSLVTDKHMQSALNWIEKQESPSLISPNFVLPYDVGISSLLRFPLYDIDFGWGTPSYVHFLMPLCEGIIFLLPSPLGPGHVEASVYLQEEHMEKFEDYISDV